MLDEEHIVCYIHQRYPNDEQPRNRKIPVFALYCLAEVILNWLSGAGGGIGYIGPCRLNLITQGKVATVRVRVRVQGCASQKTWLSLVDVRFL